jgi:hypothetical protein
VAKKKTESAWEDLPSTPSLNRGIFIDIIGMEGTGKSTFALTLPGPIAYVDIDQSVDRAKRTEGTKVRVIRVNYALTVGMSNEEVSKACRPAWNKAAESLTEAIGDWASSAVIDTGTEAWELKRLSSFGTLNPSGNRMDRLYGPVNASFRLMLRTVYRTNKKHLVIVHQMYDEYMDKMRDGKVQSVRTGNKVPRGFKEVGYMSDVQIKTFKEDGEFKAEIITCKVPPNGPSLEGVILEDDQCNFATVMSMATDTELEEWR